MKTRSHVSAALMLSLLVAAPVARAADAGKVAVRTASLSGGGIPLKVELLLDGDSKVLQLAAPVTGFSAQVQLPRMEAWRFGHLEAGADGVGTTFREMGRVEPPAGDMLWLLFHERNPGAAGGIDDQGVEDSDANGGESGAGELPLDVHAIRVDESSLADRGIVVLNLAKAAVEIEVGGETRKVAAGESGVVQPPADGGQSFPVKMFIDFHGHRRPFVTTSWAINDGRRRLAAVVQPEGAPVPKLLTVDEIAGE